MGPDIPLPLPQEFGNDTDAYIESLLKFTTSSWLLQTLCGGVHILDFYTRSPDLYSTILPQTWRDWFRTRDIMDILDLLMREDLSQFNDNTGGPWRGGQAPPKDFLDYIREVRKHLLARDFPPRNSDLQPQKATLPRHIALGMKVKKVHEVDNFARYVDRLTLEIAASGKEPITHLVDFGSGQNYLGRALAAPPYSQHIVAVESKQHNIEGAKNMDVLARLVPKPLVMRNKKEYRAQTGKGKKKKPGVGTNGSSVLSRSDRVQTANSEIQDDSHQIHTNAVQPTIEPSKAEEVICDDEGCMVVPAPTIPTLEPKEIISTKADHIGPDEGETTATTNLRVYSEGNGSVQYVEHIIKDGDLTPVIDQVLDTSRVPLHNDNSQASAVTEPNDLNKVPKPTNVNAMVISLHSCGNLVHHGLRSMLLSPHISAVAMVGCCYNLVTERLGPPTYKLPSLRPNHPRLVATSNAFDPHGFPMSEKLATYPLPHQSLDPSNSDGQDQNNETNDPEVPRGVRLNITARMMAVQAPFNWGPVDSDTFFTRHFYRALLQRIFLDRDVISAPSPSSNGSAVSANGHTSNVTWTPPNGRGPGLSSDGTSTPLTIGTLRKFAYGDFVSYVRAAVTKLTEANSFCEVDPEFIRGKMEGLTDEDIRGYEESYKEKKKQLSVMWSLMAFSAGVVEAVVVVDRWLWLKEQESVGEAWVEAVFEYKHSPRNLVVVGIKK